MLAYCWETEGIADRSRREPIPGTRQLFAEPDILSIKILLPCTPGNANSLPDRTEPQLVSGKDSTCPPERPGAS